MSLATRCTSCGTIFRVVQDQLKVSEGWVRCGRCQETFNALEGLFDLEREAPPQRMPKPSAAPSVVDGMAEFVASQHPGTPEHSPRAVPATDERDAIESRFLAPPSGDSQSGDYPDFADARFPSELPLDTDANGAVTSDSDGTGEAPQPDAAPAPPRTPLLQRWRDRRTARQAAAMSSLLEAPPIGDETVAPPAPAAAPAVPGTPGFLRQAENAARWRRPRVRASLVVATALLLGMLLTQIAVQFRDAFAAQWPQARPTLEMLCEVMDCRIEPLRRLAAITVESSGLTQVEGSDAHRLSLTLHNRGQVDIALPSIDLSLSDSSGTLIARRALAPADFRTTPGDGVPGAAIAPGSESQLQVLLAARGARISGYTVELFYP